MKLHITEKAVKEVTVPEGKKSFLIFDIEQPGFAVQKTVTGNMSYIVMYRDEFKKQRQEKLGKVGEISANAARQKRIDLLSRPAPGISSERKRRSGQASSRSR